MKLVGFAYENADPPLASGYIRLSDLSILLGPNDSGKTRSVSLIGECLSHVEQLPAWDPEMGFGDWGVFFCELDPDEFQLVAGHALGDLVPVPAIDDENERIATRASELMWGEGAPEGSRFTWAPGIWAELGLDEAVLQEGADPRVAWRDVLERHLPDDLDVAMPVLRALADSSLVAIQSDWFDGECVLNLFWCLPAEGELPAGVTSGLEALGVLAEADQGDVATPAPIKVAPIGRLAVPLLPAPITVPTDFAAIHEHLEDALTNALDVIRWRPADIKAGLGDEDASDRTDNEAWLELDQDGSVAKLHPDAVHLCELVGASATQLLPRFISERYDVVLRPLTFSAWAGGARTELLLRTREDEVEFSVDAVAAGLQLWLQLSLLEAADAVKRLALTADVYLHDWERCEEVRRFGEFDSSDEEAAAGEASEEAWADFESLLELLRSSDALSAATSRLELGDFEPRGVRRLLAHVQRRALGMARGNLYLIDEPEQHLHPALQRAAAPWLDEMVRTRRSQALATTHSPAFLSLHGNAAFSWLARRAGQVVVEGFSPEELEAADAICAELGFDRGELLGSIRVLLFVEGTGDRQVITELFGEELAQAGVGVIPFHGVGHIGEVLDDLLVRRTAAEVAVLVDNVPPQSVQLLQSDPDFRRRALADHNRQELAALARLRQTAEQAEKDVAIYALPGKDIFDVLDDQVLEDRFPDWPGHLEANRRWEGARQNGYKSARARFYEQHYGVDKRPETLQRLAAEMARRGLKPQPLADIVLELERLSL